MSAGAPPSAAGRRRPYLEIADQVRSWVDEQLGAPVVHATTQIGGMSPGCAARVRTDDGRRAFVKAVSSEANPRTPDLFRHEIAILSRLAPAPYRPDLLAVYDDDTWVALLLTDVEGHHPDLTDAAQAESVWAAVETQARELTPPPSGLQIRTLADVARRWGEGWETMRTESSSVLPQWAAVRVDELAGRAATLADRLPPDSLCHWDIRNDNLLVRPDGSTVIVDWGMASLGPAWGDLFMLSLAWADQPDFDGYLGRFAADPEVVTDLLVSLGGWLAFRAGQPAPPGLPTLPAFQRREAGRLLSAARRRLDRR